MDNVRIGQVLWIDGDTPEGRFISFAEAVEKLAIALPHVYLPPELYISGLAVMLNRNREHMVVFTLRLHDHSFGEYCDLSEETIQKWRTN